MFNYYEIKITGKNIYHFFNRIIENNINIYDVIYKKQEIIFKISYEDYEKIEKIKTIYDIKIVKIRGIKYIKKLFKFYKTYLLFFTIGLFIVIISSNFIININIKIDNDYLKNMILTELNNNNISVFSWNKSFAKRKKIATAIKEKYNDLIEEIEIVKSGTHYEVNVIERIKKNKENNNAFHNIVASKSGFILDMYIESGEILKNKGDYVSKGEVIVSNNITKNGEIKGIVNAKGSVYAEVWYKVKINYPKKTKIQRNSIGIKELNIVLLNKKTTILKWKKKYLKNEKKISLFHNKYFSLELESRYLENLVEQNYSKEEIIKNSEMLAKNKIEQALNQNEKILHQKTLKIESYNDKMYVEVFFKVYENIAKEE